MSLTTNIIESTSTVTGYGGVFIGNNSVIIIIAFMVLCCAALCYLLPRHWSKKAQQLAENRKKLTWCQICDVDMILNGATITREYFTGTRTYPVYKCPKCQIQRIGK